MDSIDITFVLRFIWAPIIGYIFWEIRSLRAKIYSLHEEMHRDKEEYLQELRRTDQRVHEATDYGSLCQNFKRVGTK